MELDMTRRLPGDDTFDRGERAVVAISYAFL